jgi:hypothetical protein
MAINTNELMRGNKVIVGKGSDWEEIVVVDEIFDGIVGLQGREFTTYASVLEPITITEELLLKNGFVKELLIEGNERYDDWVSYKKEVNGYFLEIRHCSNSIERDWSVHVDNDHHCSVGCVDIEYVHQLQNTCRLAGVEIELKV